MTERARRGDGCSAPAARCRTSSCGSTGFPSRAPRSRPPISSAPSAASRATRRWRSRGSAAARAMPARIGDAAGRHRQPRHRHAGTRGRRLQRRGARAGRHLLGVADHDRRQRRETDLDPARPRPARHRARRRGEHRGRGGRRGVARQPLSGFHHPDRPSGGGARHPARARHRLRRSRRPIPRCHFATT